MKSDCLTCVGVGSVVCSGWSIGNLECPDDVGGGLVSPEADLEGKSLFLAHSADWTLRKAVLSPGHGLGSPEGWGSLRRRATT